MYKELKNKMINLQYSLPRQQQKVCGYVIENIDDISKMTIQELSQKSNVGTATISRFIEKLGYDKYPDFINSIIRYNYDNKENTWWHLKKSLQEDSEDANSLIKVGNSSISDIKKMINKQNLKEYNKLLHLLLHADKLYFLGMRTSKSISFYFEMMLKGILKDTFQLSWNPDFIYDNSLRFSEDDALVIIALSPYSKQCIDFVNYCRQETNISVALITDVETCPIIKNCDTYLVAGQSNNRYSVIPIIALLESIIIDLGKKQSESISRISKLNEIHRKRNITTT